MHKIISFFLAVFTPAIMFLHAEPVTIELATKVASNKIIQMQKYGRSGDPKLLYIGTGENSQNLFYLFELNPSGFIVISADNNLPPVIAYSFTNDPGTLQGDENILISILKTDITYRMANVSGLPQEIIQQRYHAWQSLLNSGSTAVTKKFQQWPPEGSTSTGGWLETNWTQNAPYNNFCPMDPVNNLRSIAGCPAVAMAQIVNYYATINETVFTDNDDYHHNYAGRNYWIDDDHEDIDFPSFPELNNWLDTLSMAFANQSALKADLKAALNFACGVAAKQVYTSSISGTFGVNQAYDAYMKFGFESAVLKDDNDTSLYMSLSNNMMGARPVHLAVVDPAGTMGHNLVIDGYNTDEYYHLNFGWGGSYNGWYLLPDEIPYGLTIIEGAIVDIAMPPVVSKINTTISATLEFRLSIFPNPVTNEFTIQFVNPGNTRVKIEILNATGMVVKSLLKDHLQNGIITIKTSDWLLSSGVYICRITTNSTSAIQKFVKR